MFFFLHESFALAPVITIDRHVFLGNRGRCKVSKQGSPPIKTRCNRLTWLRSQVQYVADASPNPPRSINILTSSALTISLALSSSTFSGSPFTRRARGREALQFVILAVGFVFVWDHLWGGMVSPRRGDYLQILG